MIYIKNLPELNKASHFPLLMRAQIYLLLSRSLHMKILEHETEFYAIPSYVELFREKFSFLKNIGCTEELKDYVLFPLMLNQNDATIFYIPTQFIKYLL